MKENSRDIGWCNLLQHMGLEFIFYGSTSPKKLQFSEPETLVKFPHQDQTAIRTGTRTLELNVERNVEGEEEHLILCLTNRVLTSVTALKIASTLMTASVRWFVGGTQNENMG